MNVNSIKEFLIKKGCPKQFLDTSPDKTLRSIARELGMTIPDADCGLSVYVPEKSKAGPGVYLTVHVGKSRDGMFRLNDGPKLSDVGRAALRSLGEQLVELGKDPSAEPTPAA